MPPSLSLTALEFGYQYALFRPLTLQCHPGEIWALLGANGRGKSALLATLTGLLPPWRGRCTSGRAVAWFHRASAPPSPGESQTSS